LALLPYPKYEELSPRSQASLDSFRKEHGRVPILRNIMALHAPLVEGIDHLYDPLMTQGQLSRQMKEAIFVVTSRARECFY
jgi:hypothetical protein